MDTFKRIAGDVTGVETWRRTGRVGEAVLKVVCPATAEVRRLGQEYPGSVTGRDFVLPVLIDTVGNVGAVVTACVAGVPAGLGAKAIFNSAGALAQPNPPVSL